MGNARYRWGGMRAGRPHPRLRHDPKGLAPGNRVPVGAFLREPSGSTIRGLQLTVFLPATFRTGPRGPPFPPLR
jgi:hypothetical protein